MASERTDAVIAAATVAAAGAVFVNEPAPLRLGSALLLLFVLPGAALGRAVLPRPALAGGWAPVLAVALSVTTTALATLALDLAGFEQDRRLWSVAVGATTLVAIAASLGRRPPRRARHASARAPGPRFRWRWPRLRDSLLLTLAVVFLFVSAFVAVRPSNPPTGVQGYTQLWLVPRTASTVELGVASFELRPTRYRVELEIKGLRDQIPTSPDGDPSARSSSTFDVAQLSTGQRWTTQVTRGPGTVVASLYRLEHPDVLYRQVHLRGVAEVPAPGPGGSEFLRSLAPGLAGVERINSGAEAGG